MKFYSTLSLAATIFSADRDLPTTQWSLYIMRMQSLAYIRYIKMTLEHLYIVIGLLIMSHGAVTQGLFILKNDTCTEY